MRAAGSSSWRPPSLIHTTTSLSDHSDQSDQSGMTIRHDPTPRSTLLGEIQNKLGNEQVTSEMRAFCEFSEKTNLNPLIAMSKDELLALSDNCKKAIGQWHQRARYMEGGTTKSLATTRRSSTASNMVRLTPTPYLSANLS